MTDTIETWAPLWLDRDWGPCFERKSYGRIFVRTADDIERVRAICRAIDPDEVDGYMPRDFIAVWPGATEARLVYGHKFELRTDVLTLRCWSAGIDVLIVTGKRHDTPGIDRG